VEHRHALDVLQRRAPVHVAVAHQGEKGFDAFGDKGLRQGFVDRCAGHGVDHSLGMSAGKRLRRDIERPLVQADA
jgi:hypothetical protein